MEKGNPWAMAVELMFVERIEKVIQWLNEILSNRKSSYCNGELKQIKLFKSDSIFNSN